MADEFQTSGNWWDSSRSTSRFEAGTSPSSSALNSLGSFGWSSTTTTDNNNNNNNNMVDIKSRSSMDSGTSSMVFHDTQKLQQGQDSSSPAATAGDPGLHMMGLGLSSQAMDWNQAALLGENKAAASESSSFRSILLEENNMSSSSQGNSFPQEITSSGQLQWRDQKLLLFPGDSSSKDTSYKQMSRTNTTTGFSLDHHQHQHHHHEFSPQYSSGDGSTVTCQQGGGGLANSSSFQVDSAALYGSPSAILLQGLFGPDQATHTNSSLPYNSPNYGVMSTTSNEVLAPSSNWSSNSTNKMPQFLRTSPPPPKQPSNYSHLQFSNNAPFWNAPEATAMKDVRTSFFSTLQPQFPTTTYEEKPKNISEVRDQSGGVVAKKSGNEAASNKRPRNDQNPSPLPAFKVRKEKMGDRITALQQLVSPFGKTDTASVLSEAIEYIKFLHEQVTVLSTPYMKSGASIQHQQNNSDHKSKDPEDPKQDLRSRGLCLVPVSSTFPVTHETTVDFWTPTFGGTFR
ncbi:Myc-type, basic helix-loop-helix (bHLH) domain containing protein [Trema orientale]|uniref:Myc-type, basic helix-loop-helix (BHLH) domain containing protein n=1 Tax=Trema orientale TaxID=63057 RepID=A0A2P5D2X5_TREOI|nr:Myc-type, basic helix-loop-helix (bHLH) domain containing protein [Trema orientale]